MQGEEKREAERVPILGELHGEMMVYQPLLVRDISRVSCANSLLFGPVLPPPGTRNGSSSAKRPLPASMAASLARAALIGTPPADGWEAEVARGAAARFPVAASDLPHLSGAALGQRLKALEEVWLSSGLRLSKAQLLG